MTVLQAVILGINDTKVPYARQRAFLACAAHVVEIFVSMLRDRAGYVLDGSRDVCVFLGPRGENPKYQQVSAKPQPISHYFVKDFDAARFFDAPQEQRDLLTLAILEAALVDIAECVGADREPIRQAAEDTRRTGFDACLPAPRIPPWDKHPPEETTGSGLTATLVRRVALGKNDWGVQVRDQAGTEVAKVWIPPKTYQYISAGQLSRRACCKGELFWLEDEHGKTFFKLDLGKIAKSRGIPTPAPVKKLAPPRVAKKRPGKVKRK